MCFDRRSRNDRRRHDVGPPRGHAERRNGARQVDGQFDPDAVVRIATKAVQLYAESHPRPSQVTQEQAAEMAGVSRATIVRMIKAGLRMKKRRPEGRRPCLLKLNWSTQQARQV